jgi:hypothetical protein
VVRRIETWEFTGAYDPVTHEALCADGLCNAPAPGEIGNLISTQMTVALVQSDSVTVTKTGTGSGTVESSDKRIACGSKCVAPYDNGQLVTLSAKSASGSTFGGWSGACAGLGATCTVSAVGHVDVGVAFIASPSGGGGGGGGGSTTTSFTLQVGRSNAGTVVATPSGDRQINCGKDCSAKYSAGTAVTLTATPPIGKAFIGWSGGCAGAAATCTITMNANVSVQAAFSK